jgi:hypothetical protein
MLGLMLGAPSCAPKLPPPAPISEGPAESWDDVAAHAGGPAVVRGIYTLVDVQKRPVAEPKLLGHVALKLADGTSVFLEPMWSNAAIRPEAERQAFAGKMVDASGTLHAETPEPPVPMAMIVAPCLSPVEDIRASR